MLKHLKYLIVAIALICTAPVYAQQDEYVAMREEVIQYINEYRAKKGLPALEMNDTISEAAFKHCQYMGNKTIRINHDGFEDRMHGLMKQLAPSYGAAENVANGQTNAKEVVNMWINSRGHRENIEGNYNLSGIGIYKNKNGILYFTHIFIKRKTTPTKQISKT